MTLKDVVEEATRILAHYRAGHPRPEDLAYVVMVIDCQEGKPIIGTDLSDVALGNAFGALAGYYANGGEDYDRETKFVDEGLQ